jgi:dissimilatory sulfite reductase (desulfoviridin) alpha/beta subunit
MAKTEIIKLRVTYAEKLEWGDLVKRAGMKGYSELVRDGVKRSADNIARKERKAEKDGEK